MYVDGMRDGSRSWITSSHIASMRAPTAASIGSMSSMLVTGNALSTTGVSGVRRTTEGHRRTTEVRGARVRRAGGGQTN